VTSARPLTSTSSAQLRLTSPQTPSTRQRGIVEPPCGRPAVNAGYVARMPNSTHSPAPQDQSGAPPVQRRQDWMRAHKRFPAASPVKVTPPWPQPRQSLEDDLSPAPQGYRNPISPRQEYRSTVSPAQGYRNPISPRQDYRSTVSPAQGYRNPVSPRQDYRNPISPRQDYRNPVSPAQGYRNPISPPRGYRNPISTRQGYQSLPHVPRPMDPVASKCDKPVPKRYDDILEKLAAPKSAETAATVEEAAFTPLRNRSELEGKCASLDSTSTDGPLDSTSAGGSTRMSDAEEPLGSPDDDASALVAVMDFVGGPSCVAPPECKAVMARDPPTIYDLDVLDAERNTVTAEKEAAERAAAEKAAEEQAAEEKAAAERAAAERIAAEQAAAEEAEKAAAELAAAQKATAEKEAAAQAPGPSAGQRFRQLLSRLSSESPRSESSCSASTPSFRSSALWMGCDETPVCGPNPQECSPAGEASGVCLDATCRSENPEHVNPRKAKFCILCGARMAPRRGSPATPMPAWLAKSLEDADAKAETPAATCEELAKSLEDADAKAETPAASSEEPMMLPFPYGANALPDCRPVVCACHGCADCSTGLAGPYRDDAFLADMEALEDFRKLLQFETLILRAATDD